MYRFLLTSRWLGGLALALAMSAVCVLLGLWQWDRREQALERNAPVVENYDAAPVPLDEALPRPATPLPGREAWTPVRMTGRYVTDETLLLRNRPLDGRPGFHVLVPFAVDEGPELLVDRGWVPVGSSGSRAAAVPAPPAGTVQVVVRLRPPEPPSPQDPPPGQLYRIVPAEVAGDLVPGAYGVLASEDPRPAAAPVRLPRPEVDEGPHLSYSLQWFVFALGCLVGYGVLARRTAADLAAAEAPESAASARRPPAPARRRRSDEETEDALLDAAERGAADRRG